MQLTASQISDRIKSLNAKGLTWGTFWQWFIANFPGSSSPDFYWCAYQATGDQQYLPPLQAWLPTPIETMNVHNDHVLPIYAEMARPFVTDSSWNDNWVPALTHLAELGLQSRLDDTDDGVLNPLKIFKRVDALLGTSYMDSQHAKDCEAKVNDFLQEAKGGVWIVSSDYDIGDVFFLCELVHLFGPDHWPDLPQFLQDYTRYLVWSTTSDFSAIEQHGDVSAPVHDPKWHYRMNLFCMLTSLLPDDAPEKALAMKMIRSRLSADAEKQPPTAYNFRFNLPILLCYFDPATLGQDAMTDADWPTGLFSHDARGIVIWRDSENFITFDARVPTNVDHDQQGGMGSWEWYQRQTDGTWKWLTVVPGGYPVNWSYYNCASIGGMDNIWGWSRTYLGAKDIDGGFQASCEMRGPYLQPGTFGPTYDYLDRWRITLTFNGKYVQTKHEWIVRDGQSVIDPTQPLFQLLLWNPTANYKVAGAQETVGPEDEPTWFGNIEKRVTFTSQVKTNVLTLNFGPGDVPQPEEAVVSFAPEPIPDPIPQPNPVPTPVPDPNVPTLDPSLFTGTAYSLSAWFKADSGQGGVLIGQTASGAVPGGEVPSGYTPVLSLGKSDGILRSSAFWHGDVNKRLATDKAYNDNNWHHAAVTYDGTTEKLYVDGALVGQQDVTNTKYADAYSYFIGTGYDAGWLGGIGWDKFTGSLDKVIGYNKVLSAEDVLAQYKLGQTTPVPAAPTIGPWSIDGWEYEVQTDGSLKQSRVIPRSAPMT